MEHDDTETFPENLLALQCMNFDEIHRLFMGHFFLVIILHRMGFPRNPPSDTMSCLVATGEKTPPKRSQRAHA